MKPKYFAYSKGINREGEKPQLVYVLRPSALTLLMGEFGVLSEKKYHPRTSYRSSGELQKAMAKLKGRNLETRLITNRLSAFSRKLTHEKFQGKRETIYRIPERPLLSST